jgi:CheY-like chemotaxis protein
MASLLVVEDDADNAEVLERTLAKDGHSVALAANGWEALIALDERSVDAVVLDLMMPGMDGRTFLKILRQDARHADIPVIVVTGAPGVGDGTSVAANLGVVACLIKANYTTDQLRDLVRAALDRGDPRLADGGGGDATPRAFGA